MASVFGHAMASSAITSCFSITKKDAFLLFFVAIGCSIIPDADVLTFRFGIPYEHPFGHRGFTHSFFFAIILAFLFRWLFFFNTPRNSSRGWTIVLLLFLSTASHGILDAMTTGGRGIAFFAPFDNTRYFLPWRVIRVSPMSASRFFSEWGIRVLFSEAFWIGIPSILILIFNYWRKSGRRGDE